MLPFDRQPACCWSTILSSSSVPSLNIFSAAKMFSKPIAFFTLFCLSLQVSATPLSTPNSNLNLLGRATTPCQPGGQPILYQNYYNAPYGLCGPPKNALGLDGENIICPGNFGDSCYTYCEVYQYFQYDVEQPVVANPYCHGPLTCTVTDSMAFTYTYSGSFNAGLGSDLTKVLSAGVTGGFSYASAKTQLIAKSISLTSGQCGYMTFLPELHYSWYVIYSYAWSPLSPSPPSLLPPLPPPPHHHRPHHK